MDFEIVADFDGTLTKKGEGLFSSFEALRELLPDAAQTKARSVYSFYSPKEFDFSLQENERDLLMKEWWTKELEASAECRFSKDLLALAATSQGLSLRDSARELFSFSKTHAIPFLVFTAGHADVVEAKLKQEGLLYGNVQIFGNHFSFDEEGSCNGFMKPLVYVDNKHLVAREIEGKVHAKTAFLLGDHPTDASMCDEANHESVIRFGFLNEKYSDRESFLAYDYLYDAKDASLEGAFEIIKKEVEKALRS